MPESPLEMRFDPQTINHLGLRMYSTLPPALAEIISNSYDADAENVIITLSEENGTPKEIKVEDDGIGLSLDEIKTKFLVIGRNRRIDGDDPSPKFGRLPTGKKGLGKLALFGLAETITVLTRQKGKLNEFVLDWNELMQAKSVYHPKATKINEVTTANDGTTVTLTGLKRKTAFDFSGLADSLSRIFIFDNDFNVVIESPEGDRVSIDNKRKYNAFTKEFEWSLDSTLLVPDTSEYYGKIQGKLLTSEKPITPSSGLRGITLFSRGKLVNAPEFFSSSTSSHFYQYLTGWISADFIDLLDEDVISTNRQSIDWEHPEMEKFRQFLSGIVSQVNTDWRRKRKEKKDKDLVEKIGIDTDQWIGTMPDDIKENTSRILEALSGEDAFEKFTPVIKALHEIVPEYPLLHWRHLHKDVQESSRQYYFDKNYYTAFLEATKKYVNATIQKSGEHNLPEKDLMGKVFCNPNPILDVVDNYKQQDGNEFTGNTKKNIQEGQQHLSQGLIVGGRHPLSHEEIEELKTSNLFSEKDCLDMLSLLSHLFNRLDNSVKKTS
ncbi:MAG: TIGR02391 family protein [Caldilineaceae bacterium]|nr:TIGR02391 family protein [Caldilineaceae bacterium]